MTDPILVAVTRDQFFEFIRNDPRDIMPSHTYPDRTIWETKHRTLIGVTRPGWRNPGDPKSYELTRAAFDTL